MLFIFVRTVKEKGNSFSYKLIMKILDSLFNPVYGYVRAAIAILLGAIFIIWPDISLNYIVQFIGVALIIIGLIPLISSMKDKQAAFLSANGVFDIILGIVLLVMPSFFVSIIMLVVGLFFITFGIGQLTNLVSANKYSKVVLRYYILPILLTLFGIILIFNPFKSVTTFLMIIGIALVVYGVSEVISTYKVRKAMKNSGLFEPKVVDADYEEVKE